MSDIQRFSDFISHITCLVLRKSIFSFYSNENHVGYDTSISEECGYFIPRELRGYVKVDTFSCENSRRTAHEVSHGFYLENIPVGQRIVSHDIEIADTERHVFGRLLKRNEKCLILTRQGSLGTHDADAVPKDLIGFIPQDADLTSYDIVAFLNTCDFEQYRALRNSYSSEVAGDMENQEGFCTLLEVKSVEDVDPLFADQISRYNEGSDCVYGRGFRKMKAVETRYGLSGVMDYLMKGGE